MTSNILNYNAFPTQCLGRLATGTQRWDTWAWKRTSPIAQFGAVVDGVGDNVPLGYEVKERKLLIVEAEAQRVCHIYRRYLDLNSVRDLARDLKHNGTRSKSGGIISRGALYALLSNPIYIGEIRHKDLRHPGLHQPIIDQDLWEQVQMRLQLNGVERTERKRLTDPSPLAGKLFDATGQRLTPSHAVKQGRRYRYYVSQTLITGNGENIQGWRLPAPDLERAVTQALSNILADRVGLSGFFSEAGIAPAYLQACLSNAKERMQRPDLISLVQRVEISEERLTLTVPLASLVPKEADVAEAEALTLVRIIPLRIKKRGIEMRLIIAGDTTPYRADPYLLKTVARAHRWWNELASGAMPSVTSIAKREGVSDGHIGHHLPLAFPAPDIVQAIVTGNHLPDLTAETLIKRIDLPRDWAQQKTLLGFN